MEFDDAFKLIDAAISAQAGRHLSAPEVTLLKGTWQGMTYEQMADNSQYSLNYLMRDIGPKFWRLLSSALGEEVSKTNIRILLEQRAGQGATILEINSDLPISVSTRGRKRKNVEPTESVPSWSERAPNPVWDVMPEIPVFYGRDEELDQLHQWVVDDHVQLVSIHGLSGVGKTALARMCIDDVQSSFEHVLWRSVEHGPSLSTLIAHLFKAMGQTFSRVANPISQFMTYLQSNRCLLILDGVEALLEPQRLAGHYRNGFEEYGELFRRLADVSHQSCMILTGIESPVDVAMQNSDAVAVRSLELGGLLADDAQALLESEGLSDTEQWGTLIHRYAGYPGALIAVSSLSHTLFNGKVSDFLDRQTFVFGDISQQIQKSFQRLSPLEKEVLFFLGLKGEPISFAHLEAGLPVSVTGRELFEVLASLRSRSLIVTPEVKKQSLFALSNLVMEFITGVLIQEISGQALTMHGTRAAVSHPSAELEEVLDLSPQSNDQPICLSNWLQQSYPADWQSVGAFFAHREEVIPRLKSTYHLRAATVEKRFKRLLLGSSSKACTIGLLVSVTAESEKKLGVRVQIQPLDRSLVLPEDLSMSLLNGAGDVLRTVETEHQASDLRLPLFRGDREERFMIQVSLNKHKVIESFVI